MRRAFLAIFALLFALAAAAGEPGPDFKFSAVSSRVKDGRTECVFRVEAVKGTILSLDKGLSGVGSWTDDRGTDLGAKPVDKRSDRTTQPWYSRSDRAEDGRARDLTVTSPAAAAAGAKTFSIKGRIKLKHATKVRKGKITNVLLRNGNTFRIGTQEVRISAVIQKEKQTEFQLKFVDAGEGFHVQVLQIYEGADKRVFASRSALSFRGTDGKKSPTLRFYNIKTRLARATFSYVLWSDAREIEVPFSVTVPLGSVVAKKPDPTVKKPDPAVVAPKTTPIISPKYGLKLAKDTFGISEPPTVTFTKPIDVKKGKRFLIVLVPAGKPDDYWGHWKLVPAGAKDITLRAPRAAGDYELRLGRAVFPAKDYTVVERVKVKVK